MFNRNPPCPGDPNDYDLITTHEGKYWRRKRGTVKPATLNNACQLANDAIKTLSPIASKIALCVRPYLTGFKTGRLNIRIASCLRKSLKETNRFQLAYLRGMQFQREQPLERMVLRYVVYERNASIHIEINIGKGYILPQNNVATDYYFEAFLVYGDILTDRTLTCENVISPLYSFNSNESGKCCLSLPLPIEDDWMVLLKISCLEGNNLASHTKHYRLKVISARNAYPNAI